MQMSRLIMRVHGFCFIIYFFFFRSSMQSMQNGERDSLDMVPKLRHCIGNIINGVVFGKHYSQDDPVWIWLQHLLDEGIKAVAVAGPLNFLPILRFY